MATHSEVIQAIGREQWEALQSSGLPLMVTNELLSIWLEGWPERFHALVSCGALLPMLKGMGTSLRKARDLAGDPNMTHINLSEKLAMAGLPLVLFG